MLTALILLQLLIPPSHSFFFGSGSSGGSGCGCPCPIVPPVPICAPPPICAQPAPCQNSYSTSYSSAYSPSYSPSYSSYASSPALASPYYQPGWSPAIPSPSPSYSIAPQPIAIPTQYTQAPPIFTSIPVPMPIPGPLPPSPIYMPQPPPLPVVTQDPYDKITIVSTLATTPTYLQSGYAPSPKAYEQQYDEEGVAPPPPPPPPPLPEEIPKEIDSSNYNYRTSEVITPTTYYKPSFGQTMNYMMEPPEDSPPSYYSDKYGQFETRHNILKRMKGETVTRTNNTCNSMKLANVMMRAIVEDVSMSKRMIQHATKESFDGAKFDVFCAVGEFSYSIHSRKYCEVTKESVTCFAFR